MANRVQGHLERRLGAILAARMGRREFIDYCLGQVGNCGPALTH